MPDIVHSLDLKQTVTLKLKLPRLFGFRMWLTVNLLLLAGLVSPVTIETCFDDA